MAMPTMFSLTMPGAVMAVLMLSLLPLGSKGLFPGSTMAGSEQLEAYITYKCQEGNPGCRHVLDVRHIYSHTNEGGIDSRLTLGQFTYLAVTVRSSHKEPFSILLHRGNFSSDPAAAVAAAVDITQTAVLITMSCDQDTFQDPFLFVTILRPDAAASNFDFSFAIKKTMIGPDGGGVHVIPAQAMAVLAAPVLGSMSGDQMSTYEVTIKVASVFPETSEVALRVLGTQTECTSIHKAASMDPWGATVWSAKGSITATIKIGHLEAGYLFIGILGNSPRRQLVELQASTRVLPRDGLPEEQWPQPPPEPEDTFLRNMLLGERLHHAGHYWLASEAFRKAHLLAPDDPAPAAKQLKVWLAASKQDGILHPEAQRWSAEVRATALYGLVREIGDVSREIGSQADTGRASMIRKSRDTLYNHLAAAKSGAAELACMAGDVEGAELITDETLSQLEHTDTVYMKALWDVSQMFKRHGAWAQAARGLKKLSLIDAESWFVHHHYAGMLANGGRLGEARDALGKAMEKEGGDKGSSLLLLAEITLSLQGCGDPKEVHDLVDKAGAAGAPTEGKAEMLTAIAYLCEDGMAAVMAGWEHRCGELLSTCRDLLGFGGGDAGQCDLLPCSKAQRTRAERGAAGEGGAEKTVGSEESPLPPREL